MDEHVARLQDMLRCERVKVSYCKRILLSEYLFTFIPPPLGHLFPLASALICSCGVTSRRQS